MTILEITTITVLTLLGHAAPEHAHCWCDSARVQNGWCDPCEVGYIGGISVPYLDVVEALDTHGHPIDLASLECGGCREAAAVDAICQTCGWGLVDGRIYASKLTYYLALARHREGDQAATPTSAQETPKGPALCTTCRSILPSDPPHWCEHCQRGTIATFVFHDAAVFTAAHREFARFRSALREAPTCRTCAIARYFGSSCPTHPPAATGEEP